MTTPPAIGRPMQDPALLDEILERRGPDTGRVAQPTGQVGHRKFDRVRLRDRWRRPPGATVVEHRAPVGLLLARPLLLLLCALIGALIGYGTGGRGGFQASAVVAFTTAGSDSTLVKQTGQTIASMATGSDVLEAAAATLGSNGPGLADHVSAEWQQDTQLVNITAKGASPSTAVAQANAVAQATLRSSAANLAARLQAAHNESNQALNSGRLNSPDAEAARRSAVGNSLGTLQNSIAGESSSLTIVNPAVSGSVTGLTRTMRTAVGLAAGLLLGGLLSLLLGVRGLAASSQGALRRLLPGVDLRSPSQAAQIAGQLVEAGQKCVAVIATPGAHHDAVKLAEDIAVFATADGVTVALKRPEELDERLAAISVLRRDSRLDVRGRFGTDMLIVVVSANSDASALLEGQSDLGAVVVLRRRRTPITTGIQVMGAYRRAQPILVLAG